MVVTLEVTPMVFVYIVNKPGHDLHDEDTLVEATSREEADQIAKRRADAWRCGLKYVGRRESRRYVFDVPKSELPEWAQEVA
jgi:hypothetical protein